MRVTYENNLGVQMNGYYIPKWEISKYTRCVGVYKNIASAFLHWLNYTLYSPKLEFRDLTARK